MEDSLCLVGKVWTQKSFNVFGLLDTMKRLWNPAYGLTCREIETNLFSFQFKNIRDLQKVLSMEPWTFNKHILVLKRAKSDVQPSAMNMDSVPFWIRIYDLPYGGRSEDIIQQIGTRIGKVLEIDKSTLQGMSRSVRVKVEINLRKPLRRGTKISMGQGEPLWLPLKYERLQSFCYTCGRLGHNLNECDTDEDKEEPLYGEWLRASPMKQSKVVVEEGFRANLSSKKCIKYDTNDKRWDKEEEEETGQGKETDKETKQKVDDIANTLKRVGMTQNSLSTTKMTSFKDPEQEEAKVRSEQNTITSKPATQPLPSVKIPSHLLLFPTPTPLPFNITNTTQALTPLSDLIKLVQNPNPQKKTNPYTPPHRLNTSHQKAPQSQKNLTKMPSTKSKPKDKPSQKPMLQTSLNSNTTSVPKIWKRQNREADQTKNPILQSSGKRKEDPIYDQEMQDVGKKTKMEPVEQEASEKVPESISMAEAAGQLRQNL